MFRKLRSHVLLLGALTFLLTACGSDTIEQIVVSPDSLELEVGEAHALSAAFQYKSGSTKPVSVTWSSADAGVATVDDGNVTAEAAGETTVTATHAISGRTASAAVTVTESESAGEGEEPGGGDEEPGEGEGEEPGNGEGEDPGDGEGEEPEDGDKDPENGEDGDPDNGDEDRGSGEDEDPDNGGEETAEITVAINAHGYDDGTLYVGQAIELMAVLGGDADEDDVTLAWAADPAAAADFDDDKANPVEVTLAAEEGAEVTITATATSADGAEDNDSVTISFESVPLFDAGEVYVGPEVLYGDAPLGTEPNPFESVTAALRYVDEDEEGIAEDAVINVAAGEYNEDETIELSSHKLLGAGSGESVLIMDGEVCAGISIDGADRATVQGVQLDVSGFACAENAAVNLNDTVAVTISDVIVSSAGTELVAAHGLGATEVGASTDPADFVALDGIRLTDAANTTIENVTVEGTHGDGISVSGKTAVNLGGHFDVESMAGPVGLNIQPDGENMIEFDVAEDFSWDAPETAADGSAFVSVVLDLTLNQIVDLSSLGPTPNPGDLMGAVKLDEHLTGAADLVEGLGLTHGVIREEQSLMFASPEAAVEYGRKALQEAGGHANIPLFELDVESEDLLLSVDGVGLRNVLAISVTTDEGVLSSDIQTLLNVYADFLQPGSLLSEGITITAGEYQIDNPITAQTDVKAGTDGEVRLVCSDASKKAFGNGVEIDEDDFTLENCAP